MTTAIALIEFNDLGCSVTPTFLFRNRFNLQLSPLYPKMNKNQCGTLKKFCILEAVRRVKLWSLNANLFFEEPHQLTKFAKQAHLDHIWQRIRPFKALIAILWDLQPLWSFSPRKTNLLRFRYSSGLVLSKTKSVTLPPPPPFFLHF